ncbi:auxin-responsive protein IAA1-like [Bidens hawaiensis]|uniref:auxin-responsive protein IAA1-like n=1 Tax=Bidens hawaiensis TaxID=980011 RepID=UPI00404A7428
MSGSGIPVSVGGEKSRRGGISAGAGGCGRSLQAAAIAVSPFDGRLDCRWSLETCLSEASSTSKSSTNASQGDNKNVLNLKATELRLGLPGLCQDLENNSCKNSPTKKNVAGAKRGFSDTNKAQVVGWPPIRSFRKNTMAPNSSKNGGAAEGKSGCGGCLYVKVSMDGAPYLRKVDLKSCKSYTQLSTTLEKMFNCFTLGQCSSIRAKEGLSENNLKNVLRRDECVLTYEDKDGDWMLVGDVPWE